jgi:hypothetical protein
VGAIDGAVRGATTARGPAERRGKAGKVQINLDKQIAAVFGGDDERPEVAFAEGELAHITLLDIWC